MFIIIGHATAMMRMLIDLRAPLIRIYEEKCSWASRKAGRNPLHFPTGLKASGTEKVIFFPGVDAWVVKPF